MPRIPTIPQSPIPVCAAIIVASGSSRRMGLDKLLWRLDGVPVLRRAIEAFDSAPAISTLVVVCPADRWMLLDSVDFSKPVVRVDGGPTRQESVARGLAALPAECVMVAVHDGARPLVSADDIARCVEAAEAHGAAALARRVTETMMRSDPADFSSEPVNRDLLWSMETPQIFSTSLLRKAYAGLEAGNPAFTDEVTAIATLGTRAKLVESTGPNLKITTPADLTLAEALWKTFRS